LPYTVRGYSISQLYENGEDTDEKIEKLSAAVERFLRV
jgi:hypothetical protein